jgi:hypothetical protein
MTEAIGGASGWDIEAQRMRPRMPMSERAKIFMPFNALRGLDEALRRVEEEAERTMPDGANASGEPDRTSAGDDDGDGDCDRAGASDDL